MADFAPPSGPPPPKVPEGWKAVWNDQYKEWFYVNLHTKKSVWEKPTEPARPDDGTSPDGPPPSYSAGSGQAPPTRDVKSNNPYQDALNRDRTGTGTESDEALARRLQEEENLRAGASPRATDRGQADSYYNAGPDSSLPNQYGGQQYPTSPGGPPPGVAGGSTGSRGLFSSLKNKLGGGGGSSGGLGGFGSQPPRFGGPPGPGYGYPQQGYGPPQGYSGYGPPQGYGYGQPMYAQQQPQRKHGLGTGGALALGAGGGLLGGMLLEDAISDHDQGYNDDGGDFGGDGGGDFGGGDF